jgi:hypothetical protein
MNRYIMKFIYNIVIVLGLLGFTSVSIAAEKNVLLPTGWIVLSKEKSTKDGVVTIEGFFSSRTMKTNAILIENKTESTYGVAATMRPNQMAIIVETFKDIAANPPSLSVIKSGKYRPFCPPEVKKCVPFIVKNQAIGLSFGEASAQIIYFNKNKFIVAHVSD